MDNQQTINKNYTCKICGEQFGSENALNSHIGKMHKKKFKPSDKQISLLRAMLDPETPPTITAFCEKAGIDRGSYYNWFNDIMFVEWFNKEWDLAMTRNVSWLDKVGLMKSPSDFRYWEAMQMKYANYKRKSDVTTADKPINDTNQIANLLLDVLKDGEDTSKRGKDGEAGSSQGEVSKDISS